jgi:hypothetical protein
MALSLSTAVKNEVANVLFSNAYANTGTNDQALIDARGASALTKLETEAQWFSSLAATSNAPNEWIDYFISEIVVLVSANSHPDRVGAYTKLRDQARKSAFDFYSRVAMTYDPGSNTEAFVITVQNIRNYCIGACLKNPDKPFIPAVTVIDASLAETLAEVWNRARSGFNRRPCVMKVTRTAFTGGTWTESTKVISTLTGVGTSLPTGTPFYVTGGTGATVGEYVISATTSTSITLVSSLGSAANLSADIAGFYYVVTFDGLESSEEFDSLGSVRWRYVDSAGAGEELRYIDADDFAVCRAQDGLDGVGQPVFFRTHLASGSTTAWRFSPPPDDDYTLRGEVITRQPAAPASTSATTTFAKFASEYLPTIRRRTLARVYTNSGKHNEALSHETAHEIETMFPIYQSSGSGQSYSSVRDVEGVFSEQTDWTGMLGGGQ